jgi:nickel/cobalt exporter
VTLTWALLLGFGLGLRHATDPDHVVAIGTLLDGRASAGRAARLAALWGFGHTLTLILVGMLVGVAEVRVPPNFERAGEGVVAAMLVALGCRALFRLRSGNAPRGVGLRPLFIGIVHGLGGSAGVALLALTAIPSTLGALGYLILFGVGTVAGMMLLTMLLSLPLGWSLRARGGVRRITVLAAGTLSVVLGIALGARVAYETFGARL